MEILWMIIIGFIAGALAKLIILRESESNGFILITTLGVAGAFGAAYLGPAVGWDGFGAGVIIGASVFLCLYNVVKRRQSRV